MSEGKPVRPPQVTAAAWLVMIGSVWVVVLAFARVATMHSLETREAIEDYLSRPPGDSFGLGFEEAQQLLQVAAMVAAGCAAAAGILGFYLLQRSRSARVALSFLAAPLFVSGLVGVGGGDVASAVVAAAVAMLWFQPARDWFNGVTRAPVPAPAAPVAPPRPVWPPEQRDVRLDELPPPQGPPAYASTSASGRPAYGAPVAGSPSSGRPPAVLWACVLTWVFSALAFAMLALTLALILGAPDQLLDELHRQNPDLAEQGFTDAVMRRTIYVTAAVVMVWSTGASVLGLLAWRRVRWAATSLLVSSGCAAGGCLLLVLGSVVVLVPLSACVATVVLLVRPEVRRWYAAR